MVNAQNKTVLIAGGTGFIGRALSVELFRRGYGVRILTRDAKKAQKTAQLPYEFISWDSKSPLPKAAFAGGIDTVINLAGESVFGPRWTETRKNEIYNSRIRTTKFLVDAIKENGPRLFLSTSAIGYYGDRGDEALNEQSKAASDFLAKVCIDWENEALLAKRSKTQTRIIRIGVVLGDGGALETMLPPFLAGAGGPIGSGKQYMSWIHIDDVTGLFCHALENETAEVLNATSPGPLTNRDFSKILGRVIKRPSFFTTPASVLKLTLGEMGNVVLASQKVLPENALRSGYKFKFPSLEGALKDLLAPHGYVNSRQFTAYQWIPAARDKVFDFFSRAENLQDLTPTWVGFEITNKSTPEIEKGTVIDYRLKIRGVPVRWRTLISEWQPNDVFVDVQQKGPYKVWHHTHRFEDVGQGTLITDSVVYDLPMGLLGDIAHKIMVKNDVIRIFEFRRQQIEKLFGPK